MAMHFKTFTRKPGYTGSAKSYGGARTVTSTTVIEMGPEDFHVIDDKSKLKQWASPANQEKVSRTIEGEGGGSSYWGKGITNNAALTKLIHNGWPEGAEKIMDLSTKLRDLIPTPMGPRRKLRWSDQGDSIDMARVYSGQLDTAWQSNPRVRERAPRVISIDADVGHNCHVSAEQLMWAGAGAVALTDALEDAGYRVELFSTSSALLPDGSVGLVRMIAKRAHEPLNPTLAAALVAHPATFRWYHLMAWLKCPTDVGWGFGTAFEVQAPLNAAVEEGILEGAELVLSESLAEKSAVKECTEAIERLEMDQLSGEGTML